jgi:hypothetical protein
MRLGKEKKLVEGFNITASFVFSRRQEKLCLTSTIERFLMKEI